MSINPKLKTKEFLDQILSNGKELDSRSHTTVVTKEDLSQGIQDKYGVIYSKDGTKLLKMKVDDVISIRTGTKVICDDAFADKLNLTPYEIFNGGDFVEYEPLVIPDSVIAIGNRAFANCKNLSIEKFPESLLSIGESAFSNCVKLGGSWVLYEIPCSVITIGDKAFENCCDLFAIHLPDSLKSIGAGAFGNCKSLCEINIPHSITNIEEGTFAYCETLRNISIPDSVTTIGRRAFYESSLSSIIIPNSVKSIDDEAFSHCSELTEIYIPDSVTSIGHNAFSNCFEDFDIVLWESYMSNLLKVVVSPHNSYYDSRNSCNAIIESSSNTLILGCQNTVIPNSIVSIGNNAFAGCNKLFKALIPPSVTYIGDFAYAGCFNLTNIHLPNTITYIGLGAFAYSALVEINIPDSITVISPECFYHCGKLNELHIPDSVTTICEFAFSGCDALTKLYIPDSVTTIGRNAFSDCEALIEIHMPNTVESIGKYAFPDSSSICYIPKDSNESFISMIEKHFRKENILFE